MGKTKRVQLIGPFPQSDWLQTDDTKSDYIKNKPDLSKLTNFDENVNKLISNALSEIGAAEDGEY